MDLNYCEAGSSVFLRNLGSLTLLPIRKLLLKGISQFSQLRVSTRYCGVANCFCCTSPTPSTDPTSRLHTKDKPSHRRRFYTHNLNGTDLQKLHYLPKYQSNAVLTSQYNSFHYLSFLILVPVVYLNHFKLNS